MSSDLYVKRAVADVEMELSYLGQTLRNKVSTPLSSGYCPEFDTPELSTEQRKLLQQSGYRPELDRHFLYGTPLFDVTVPY
jgi:hypothetical protein